MRNDTYFLTTLPEPHIGRTKQILNAHPELKRLFGHTPSSFVYITGIVAFQILLAALAQRMSWWFVFFTGYFMGAVANHALFVMIHDCTHNLVFKRSNPNRLAMIFTNLPIVFPCAIAFRNHHLNHHRHQGDLDADADLAGPIEARTVGRSSTGKLLWLFFFFLIEGIVRPVRVRRATHFDYWTLVNTLVEFTFLSVLFYFVGFKAVSYLVIASVFCLGLHPVGARWIQEHYVIVPGQETYSYYGPFNLLMFNVGYHNEHHDLVKVPWSRLPKIRALAPEFYENLYAHTSYLKLLARFILDPSLNLYCRVVRPSRLSSKTSS
jgi:sphingolipid delta-4 desaturase